MHTICFDLNAWRPGGRFPQSFLRLFRVTTQYESLHEWSNRLHEFATFFECLVEYFTEFRYIISNSYWEIMGLLGISFGISRNSLNFSQWIAFRFGRLGTSYAQFWRSSKSVVSLMSRSLLKCELNTSAMLPLVITKTKNLFWPQNCSTTAAL